MKRRNDATYVSDLTPYKRMLPFVMPKRVDSLVYHTLTLDFTEAVAFVREMNREEEKDHQYRVFELFLAAFLRTVVLRPHLNRFIMNYDVWQRNELSLNFVVKEEYTDEAPDHTAVLTFRPDMTFQEIATVINDFIEDSRNGGVANQSDRAIGFFLSFPKIVLRAMIRILKILDIRGIAPAALREADGLHATAFVANLGSISLMDAPYHHLYEWGTTSIFLTMGKLKRKRLVDEEGNRSFKDTMEISVTIDERISDGFYFIRSLGVLQHLLHNPELLLNAVTTPDEFITRKKRRLWRKKRVESA